DVMPHATREIPSMRAMIDALVAKGGAYDIKGGVYFDTSRAGHYGELSRFSAARMRRILAAQDDAALDDPERRDPVDFALWRRVPALAETLGRGAIGPLRRDAATREVLAALDDDLDTRTAIRALERGARRAAAGSRPSLRHLARRVLGIL